ncbi:MAG: hypothetical protein CR972_02840 [Candidatus Moraniibacteriota bacterium]|nr:MAG: hypothetical protein CR972_02840 [Candidatus Moranbacteria bacterium]
MNIQKGFGELANVTVKREIDPKHQQEEIEKLYVQFENNDAQIGDIIDCVLNIQNSKENIIDESVLNAFQRAEEAFHKKTDEISEIVFDKTSLSADEALNVGVDAIKKQKRSIIELTEIMNEMAELVGVDVADVYEDSLQSLQEKEYDEKKDDEETSDAEIDAQKVDENNSGKKEDAKNGGYKVKEVNKKKTAKKTTSKKNNKPYQNK